MSEKIMRPYQDWGLEMLLHEYSNAHYLVGEAIKGGMPSHKWEAIMVKIKDELTQRLVAKIRPYQDYDWKALLEEWDDAQRVKGRLELKSVAANYPEETKGMVAQVLDDLKHEIGLRVNSRAQETLDDHTATG